MSRVQSRWKQIIAWYVVDQKEEIKHVVQWNVRQSIWKNGKFRIPKVIRRSAAPKNAQVKNLAAGACSKG